ncbi:A24 family peptidase [Brevundimonas sp. Root1279]|uniref:A24 family peptidase n=1 Tax=Brevundimonas sp. Root1279 TaxID=1736443 RepID=UPI0006FEFCAF|nr:prepilin peptidase [Brevundimonas sp. Root1279]KQW81803.1 pilus assembly protein CpaA [Brevundimonas sp. Root1279]
MQVVQLIALAVLPALVIVAGLQDLTSMKIRNWISAALVVAFFPAALLIGLTPLAVAVHAGIGILALAITIGLFALGQMGGGDAKLIAAVSLWFGLSAGMFVLWTAVIGGAFALVILIARARTQPYLAAMPGWASTLMTPKNRIPYGVAIAGGALTAFPASPLVAAWLAGA